VLIARGLGHRTDQGIRFRQGLVNSLVQMEVQAVGQDYARAAGGTFIPTESGQAVEGRYREKLQLDSGPFAVVQTPSYGFALVPWRAVIDKQLGKDVRARIEDGLGVSWEIGRKREPHLPRF